MTVQVQKPDIAELKPRISIFGVGGGGGNAVNNMINAGLQGVEFVVANTDAQALTVSKAETRIQLGLNTTDGLGAGSHPEIGREAAEECIDEIIEHLGNSHMVFVTAGMGGGTGTGAAPVIARAAREKGILTVGVVTKPFHFEGQRRMKTAEAGIKELQSNVDTLIVIPNQNLFRIANEQTTFADAFSMADQVLYSGVASVTDLMMREGLVNLDFADVRSVMQKMGKAMMGTGEASDKGRALAAAEAAIANPLLDETSIRGARGLLISITGGCDMTLHEVDEAVSRISREVNTDDTNIIFGAIIDEALEGVIRVSVVATGIESAANAMPEGVYDTGAAVSSMASSAAAASSDSFLKKDSLIAEAEDESDEDTEGADDDGELEEDSEDTAENEENLTAQPPIVANAPRVNSAAVNAAPNRANFTPARPAEARAAAQNEARAPMQSPRPENALNVALGGSPAGVNAAPRGSMARPQPANMRNRQSASWSSGMEAYPEELNNLRRQDKAREENPGGVRGMWKRLGSLFGAGEEESAKLEPVSAEERQGRIPQMGQRNDAGNGQGQNRRMMSNMRPAPMQRPDTVYNETRRDNPSRHNIKQEEREDVIQEIPAFLRRQNR